MKQFFVCALTVLENEVQINNNLNISGQSFSCQKQISQPKTSSILHKMNIDPQIDIYFQDFLHTILLQSIKSNVVRILVNIN